MKNFMAAALLLLSFSSFADVLCTATVTEAGRVTETQDLFIMENSGKTMELALATVQISVIRYENQIQSMAGTVTNSTGVKSFRTSDLKVVGSRAHFEFALGRDASLALVCKVTL